MERAFLAQMLAAAFSISAADVLTHAVLLFLFIRRINNEPPREGSLLIQPGRQLVLSLVTSSSTLIALLLAVKRDNSTLSDALLRTFFTTPFVVTMLSEGDRRQYQNQRVDLVYTILLVFITLNRFIPAFFHHLIPGNSSLAVILLPVIIEFLVGCFESRPGRLATWTKELKWHFIRCAVLVVLMVICLIAGVWTSLGPGLFFSVALLVCLFLKLPLFEMYDFFCSNMTSRWIGPVVPPAPLSWQELQDSHAGDVERSTPAL